MADKREYDNQYGCDHKLAGHCLACVQKILADREALRLRAAVLEGCLWRNMDPSDATKEDAAIWATLPQAIANSHPAPGPNQEPEQPPCSNCGAEVKTLKGYVAHSCPGNRPAPGPKEEVEPCRNSTHVRAYGEECFHCGKPLDLAGPKEAGKAHWSKPEIVEEPRLCTPLPCGPGCRCFGCRLGAGQTAQEGAP